MPAFITGSGADGTQIEAITFRAPPLLHCAGTHEGCISHATAVSSGLPYRRDCLECRAKDGMRLQNVVASPAVAIPILYVCDRCGTQLTIPPPALSFPPRISEA